MLGCNGAGLSGLRDSWANCAQVRTIGIHRNANGQIAQDCPSVASLRVGEGIVLRIDMACGLGGRSPSSTVFAQPITDARSGNERGVRRQRMAPRPCQPATKCLGASRRVDGDTAPTGGAAVTALHSVATAMRAALAWAHEVFCERDGASSTGALSRQGGGKDRPRTRNHETMSLGEVATQACRTSLWREMDA